MSSLLEQRVTSVSCQFPDLWQSWRCGDRNRQKTANLSRYAVAHMPRSSAWIPAGVAAQSLGDLADLHLVLPRTLRVTWCELEMNFCRVCFRFQLLRGLLILVLRVTRLLGFVLQLLVRAHGSGWSSRNHLRSSRDHELASNAATVQELQLLSTLVQQPTSHHKPVWSRIVGVS